MRPGTERPTTPDFTAIPSREAFHREFAGEIRLSDFNTQQPNPRKFYPHTGTEHTEGRCSK